jgi:CelD/BcsL family acetyltransferase involved in cellulose biosynthesis
VVAGNTNVVHGQDFVCQTSWRDLDYSAHNVGVRLEELTFRWAQQAGYRFYDLGGGHSYKKQWAPVAGERYEFECTTAAGFLFRRAVDWLSRPVARLYARPGRVSGGWLGFGEPLGEPLHAVASGLGEMALEVAPYLHF